MKLGNYGLIFLALLIGFTCFAQNGTNVLAPKPQNFWDDVSFGGNVGLTFTNDVTSVIIGPSAIYNVNQQFSTGLGIAVGYTSFSDPDATQWNYSFSSINLYNPLRNLQLSGELEYTFVTTNFEFDGANVKESFSFPALYLGAGYRNGFMTIGLRYDILYNSDRNIYASPLSPFVRVFF